MRADRPPTVALTTASATPTGSDVTVTATFSAPVTGVTAADFNGGFLFPEKDGVTYTVTGGPTEWVLTVSHTTEARTASSMTFDVVAGSGSISPINVAADASLSVSYVASLLHWLRTARGEVG